MLGFNPLCVKSKQIGVVLHREFRKFDEQLLSVLDRLDKCLFYIATYDKSASEGVLL